MDLRGLTILEWFMRQVHKAPNGCWLWSGKEMHAGYGIFSVGEYKLAHRVAWMLHYGEIPPGLYVCHKCDVKSCVNPEHLELGTPLKNTRDAISRGLIKPVGFALYNSLKTHCKNGHPFDGENTAAGRYCKQCKAEYHAAYREAHLIERRAYEAQWQRQKRRSQGIGPRKIKTHCDKGHELTPENSFVRIDGGTRRCRTCTLERNRLAKRKYRAAKRDELRRVSFL